MNQIFDSLKQMIYGVPKPKPETNVEYWLRKFNEVFSTQPQVEKIHQPLSNYWIAVGIGAAVIVTGLMLSQCRAQKAPSTRLGPLGSPEISKSPSSPRSPSSPNSTPTKPLIEPVQVHQSPDTSKIEKRTFAPVTFLNLLREFMKVSLRDGKVDMLCEMFGISQSQVHDIYKSLDSIQKNPSLMNGLKQSIYDALRISSDNTYSSNDARFINLAKSIGMPGFSDPVGLPHYRQAM